MYIANQILDRKEMNSFSAHVIRRIVSLEITEYYMFYKSSLCVRLKIQYFLIEIIIQFCDPSE